MIDFYRSGGRGFTYLGVLFAIALASVGAALATQVWATLEKRAREQQLLHIGAQYRDALARYFASAPPGLPRRYPARLEDLLRDERYPDVRRYLRKIYPDPLSGKREWGLLRGPDGTIRGLHSLAAGTPLKRANFAYGFRFDQATSYAHWVFGERGVAVQADQAASQGPRAADRESEGTRPNAESSPFSDSPEHTRTCEILAANDRNACFFARRLHGPDTGAQCDTSATERLARCLAFQPLPQLRIR